MSRRYELSELSTNAHARGAANASSVASVPLLYDSSGDRKKETPKWIISPGILLYVLLGSSEMQRIRTLATKNVLTAILNSLRKQTKRRVMKGELTTVEIARRIGVRQAHVSNFINGRRGLSFAVADNLIFALGISLYDLLPRESRKIG